MTGDGSLDGLELRVFRSLVFKRQSNTLVTIRIELTDAPEPPVEEVGIALGSLVERGYLEEFRTGVWRLTAMGYERRFLLLGESRRG
jgi:hypothetical protein